MFDRIITKMNLSIYENLVDTVVICTVYDDPLIPT